MFCCAVIQCFRFSYKGLRCVFTECFPQLYCVCVCHVDKDKGLEKEMGFVFTEANDSDNQTLPPTHTHKLHCSYTRALTKDHICPCTRTHTHTLQLDEMTIPFTPTPSTRRRGGGCAAMNNKAQQAHTQFQPLRWKKGKKRSKI